ncbi:hypothetical protein ABEKA_1867 [Acinetobacter lwoffii]|nr:hypothetical protein ABEKA_1867 [Acinetobacter lwoffii]
MYYFSTAISAKSNSGFIVMTCQSSDLGQNEILDYKIS